MSAPYEVTVKGTDFEFFRWADEWLDAETGAPLNFSGFDLEYALADENGNQISLLTVGDGITIDTGTGAVTFDIGRQLEAGSYTHAGRKVMSSGITEAVFDGPVIISKGAFR